MDRRGKAYNYQVINSREVPLYRGDAIPCFWRSMVSLAEFRRAATTDWRNGVAAWSFCIRVLGVLICPSR